MPVDIHGVQAWFVELQRVYAENKERLTELDSAIGDADHGINMDRGFTAVKAYVVAAATANIGLMLQTAARKLISTVGGASGPLYGTFFIHASTVCEHKWKVEGAELAAMFRAGTDGVAKRGKAAAGDKTMLDALLPATEALERGHANGASIGEMFAGAAEAAEMGMLSTILMQARKGRASYLGARSVGHQDPGATSAHLMIRAAAEVWREK